MRNHDKIKNEFAYIGSPPLASSLFASNHPFLIVAASEPATMSDAQQPTVNGASSEQAPNGADDHPAIHPVAPRLKNGPKVPHIGPHIHAYRSIHSQTLGHESDKWWAKVCTLVFTRKRATLTRAGHRWRGTPFTGIVPSTPSVQEASRQETSSGSQKVA